MHQAAVNGEGTGRRTRRVRRPEGRVMRNAVPGESVVGEKRAFVWRREGLPSGDVAVAVVRLLAIATGVISRRRMIATATRACLPNYRSWPRIRMSQRTGAGTVGFYVCPKAVQAACEHSFPVGTQFVMETLGDWGRDVFIMKKYAALYLSERAAPDREVWMTAGCRVGHSGVRLESDWASVGFQRLPSPRRSYDTSETVTGGIGSRWMSCLVGGGRGAGR